MKVPLFKKPFPVILSFDVEHASLLICENRSWFHGNLSHHWMIYYPINSLLFLLSLSLVCTTWMVNVSISTEYEEFVLRTGVNFFFFLPLCAVMEQEFSGRKLFSCKIKFPQSISYAAHNVCVILATGIVYITCCLIHFPS